MSGTSPLSPLAAVIMIAASAGAGWSGYSYYTNNQADAFYLYEASELRSNTLQAIYLSERAATDSSVVDELQRLDEVIEASFVRLQSGDPVQGIAPAPPALRAQISALRESWNGVAQSLGKIIGSKSSTETLTRARKEVSATLAQAIKDATRASTRWEQIGKDETKLAAFRKAKEALVEASEIISRETAEGEIIRSAEPAISSYLGALSGMVGALPKDQELFSALSESYKGAQAAIKQVARLADSASGTSVTLPLARAAWAERDKINAASVSLVDIAKGLPATHAVQPVLVAALGIISLLIALIISVFAQRSAANRTQVVESRGASIMTSQQALSREHQRLKDDIVRVGSGDLDHKISEDWGSTNEIAVALNSAFGKIRGIFEEFNVTITSLSAATEQTMMTAENVDRNRQEQQQALEHIGELTSALASYVDRVESMSQSTVSVVDDVSLKVQVGSEAVNQVHEGVLILAQQNTSLQHRSKGLIESLQTLSEMAVVVSQVAERADLVAWNSNIVADQVQGNDDIARAISSAANGISLLAKKCRDAVAKIDSQLRIMNESARETQHAVDSSQRELTTLQDRSNKALSSLSAISAKTSSLRDSADDVTKQTRMLQQQASDMEKTMTTVLNYSAENAAASDQTAKAVSGVNKSAQEMLRSMKKFLRGE